MAALRSAFARCCKLLGLDQDTCVALLLLLKSREAYIHLKRAIPNLFTYIDQPEVPKTTNALEAFFGHIKDQIRSHRGLAESRIDNFIKWYLFFNDEKKKK